MKILSTLTILALVLLQSSLSLECSATHFDFIGKYTLGKQDQLNTTFTRIQEKITQLDNVTFQYNQSTSYVIFNTKPTFYYRDSKQKAEVLGNDTIIIEGGQLEVDITFQWSKKTNVLTTNGTGAAFALSDVIVFAKQAVIIEKGQFFSFELLDYSDVTWSSGDVFSINRIDPPTTLDSDKVQLTRMLNNIMSVKTVRNLLEEEIDRFYAFYLRASLHDEHMPVDNHFDYIWSPGQGKPNVTIPFTRRAVTVDIEEGGVQLTFEVQAANASKWQCGNRTVPLLPLNYRVYGSTQQFVSYDFYENVIRHAIDKDLLNADLNRDGWQSRMFQFYAGDLYEVLDKVQDRFFASAPVAGNCKAEFVGLKVWKAGFDTFNVSIHFNCELSIERTKIMDFGVGLTCEIEGVPKESTMDFKFRRHEEFVSFYKYGDYTILNEELATLMIRHSLNRMYEGNLFGSGWPMSPPRDYPHMMAEDNYTIVYDSTHVDPHLADE